jgi:transcriptional regulator with XRE-family HTH domain
MAEHAGSNLLRLMARLDVSTSEVAERTGLDERTIRAILRGTGRPQPRTLHRLAEGLGISVDEFFLDPSQLLYRHFDERTNPVVVELLASEPRLFAGWGEGDFDELHSRMGTGGPLTPEGALQAVRDMNRKRQLHDQLDVLLESSQADLAATILSAMYEKAIVPDAQT